MLDMGFLPDVKRILALLPGKRQNLLFSATMTPEVMRVAGDTLHDPVHIDVSPPSKPIEQIAQSIYPVGSQQKMDLLVRLISDNRPRARARLHAHQAPRRPRRPRARPQRHLRCRDSRQPLAGPAPAGARRLQAGRHRVLVATDIVARGIDVDNITHVINFDLPNVPEDYVHRIGRTARAGKSGTAYSLFAPEEHDQLRDIEKTIDAVIDCEDHEGFQYSEARMVPDPQRSAQPAKQQHRQTPGSGRKGRPGGGARRRRMNGGNPGASKSA